MSLAAAFWTDLETLDVSERQVDQETVAIVQSAEDECRNKPSAWVEPLTAV